MEEDHGGSCNGEDSQNVPCKEKECTGKFIFMACNMWHSMCKLTVSIVLSCQRLVPGPCYPNPCENGGRCNDIEGIRTCTCIRGCSGANCEICGGMFGGNIATRFTYYLFM